MSEKEVAVREVAEIRLAEDEEVKVEVARHPLGLFSIVFGAGFVMVTVVVLWIVMLVSDLDFLPLNEGVKSLISLIAVVLLVLTLVIAWVGVTIYRNNLFVVTNKRVIQQTSLSLFDKSVQTIDLASVEDVSFKKRGILQSLFDYGSLRLATVGDETTYQFNFVHDPEGQVRAISEVVQGVKGKKN